MMMTTMVVVVMFNATTCSFQATGTATSQSSHSAVRVVADSYRSNLGIPSEIRYLDQCDVRTIVSRAVTSDR